MPSPMRGARGDYGPRMSSRHNDAMDHVRNLRRPITARIGDQTVDLLTIGHLAHALGRTTWSVKRLGTARTASAGALHRQPRTIPGHVDVSTRWTS